MALDAVQLLSDLVRIPSVNPMGRAASGDIYYEHRVTGHLEGLFRGLGLPVERHTVAPLRDNIVTRVEGDVVHGLSRMDVSRGAGIHFGIPAAGRSAAHRSVHPTRLARF